MEPHQTGYWPQLVGGERHHPTDEASYARLLAFCVQATQAMHHIEKRMVGRPSYSLSSDSLELARPSVIVVGAHGRDEARRAAIAALGVGKPVLGLKALRTLVGGISTRSRAERAQPLHSGTMVDGARLLACENRQNGVGSRSRITIGRFSQKLT